MTRFYKSASILVTVFTAIFTQSAQAQQFNFQTSFLAPVSVRTPNTGISPVIVETEHLPYITQIAKASHNPNPSDLLIQRAEQRFGAGKKFYTDRDFLHAREEFDAAIDAMLAASENPSDPNLFESKLDDMVDTIHHDELANMGAAAEGDASAFDKAPLDDVIQMTFPLDPGIRNQVQTEVRSATSALPLVVNDAVLSYINYFKNRGHKTIEMGLEREGKYQPMISRILAEEGVPQELIHLAQAESGFLPRAVSRASAEGMWQFVKFRGNEYGLTQTPYSDDRLDPEKATRAAAHHLHDLYKRFGDWYLAIAAYNCGPAAVEHAVERTGYADFFTLRARGVLPKETTNYVPIILALTIMSKNMAAYGLDDVVPEAPLEYDTIRTVSPTSLALIGDLSDTSVPQLLQLNPALLRSVAPGDFEVRVPKGMGSQVTAALDLVPTERRASWRVHRVEAGENLSAIAHSFSLTPRQVAMANNLQDSEPAPGDNLLIPAVYHESAAPLRAAPKAKAAVSQAAHEKRTSVASKIPVHHPAGVAVAQTRRQTALLNP
jgi:membrane-bound lytic murein transglycosylase D